MTVLLVTHERFADHDTGPHHPERPARLRAIDQGVEASGLGDAVVRVPAVAAGTEALLRVHPQGHIRSLQELSAAGGGHIDADTATGPGSWEAARLAAGAGLEAVRRLDQGQARAAFCAVRPPGHHATSVRAMGFCLLNNVAVTAAALAHRGERVLVVDYDAHHGNGTQDIFYEDPRVVYVSLHQHPLYPGTGALTETGSGAGAGTTVNVPLPAGATGDVYLRAADTVIEPVADAFDPTWLLISAGFDAHRADPLTSMGLSGDDFADLTARLVPLVPAGRTVAFLEGGYDLAALRDSTAATLAVLAGERHRVEPATSGGPGAEAVEAAAAVHEV